MRFTEINLFGVYVAPISVMIVAAWVVTIGLRRFAAGSACCAMCGTLLCSCSPFTHDRALVDGPPRRGLNSRCQRSKPMRGG